MLFRYISPERLFAICFCCIFLNSTISRGQDLDIELNFIQSSNNRSLTCLHKIIIMKSVIIINYFLWCHLKICMYKLSKTICFTKKILCWIVLSVLGSNNYRRYVSLALPLNLELKFMYQIWIKLAQLFSL